MDIKWAILVFIILPEADGVRDREVLNILQLLKLGRP